MFEVIYTTYKNPGKHKVKVYSVRDAYDGIPEFLIFINCHWVWVSSIHCVPAE